MVIGKELINKIRNMFELNQYESGIWFHLLSKGVSTAGELSNISNVPRSRAYDVLESLEKKGFVMIKIGKPIQYIAVPPEEVINRVQKMIKSESEARIKRLEGLKGSELLEEMKELYEKGIKTFSPTELSGALRGRNNILNQMESMINNAQHSVKLFSTEEGIIRQLSALKKVIKKAYDKGIEIEINAPITEKNKAVINELSPLVKLSEKNEEGARYCIVDDRQALMLLLNDEEAHPNYDVGIWVNSQAISKVLGKKH
jgi:sugar-specific transcriptional regulator TrmB